MVTSRKIEATASDGKAMTLGELREFIAECDQAGAADSTPIKGEVTMRSGVKRLAADAVRFGDRLMVAGARER